MISISRAHGIPGYILSNDETGEDRLIDVDWDYPGLARTFGASLRTLVRAPIGDPEVLSTDENGQIQRLYWCEHKGTDGTIACPDCGTQPGAFIAAAADYLDNEPDPVEDPGYFDSDE